MNLSTINELLLKIQPQPENNFELDHPDWSKFSSNYHKLHKNLIIITKVKTHTPAMLKDRQHTLGVWFFIRKIYLSFTTS